MNAAILEATKRNNVSKHEIFDMISWLLLKIFERRSKYYKLIATEMLYSIKNPEFARMLLKMGDLNNEMTYEPAVYLFTYLSNDIVSTINN